MGECIIARRGIDTFDATATADQMVLGVTAYVKGKKLTGTLLPETKTSNNKWLSGSVPNIGTTHGGIGLPVSTCGATVQIKGGSPGYVYINGSDTAVSTLFVPKTGYSNPFTVYIPSSGHDFTAKLKISSGALYAEVVEVRQVNASNGWGMYCDISQTYYSK